MNKIKLPHWAVIFFGVISAAIFLASIIVSLYNIDDQISQTQTAAVYQTSTNEPTPTITLTPE